jgi:hypothetical protein
LQQGGVPGGIIHRRTERWMGGAAQSAEKQTNQDRRDSTSHGFGFFASLGSGGFSCGKTLRQALDASADEYVPSGVG